MREYVAIVGLEEHQSKVIAEQINQPTVSHIILPQRGGDGFIRAFIEKLLKR